MGDDPIDDVPDGDVFQSQCPSCKDWQDDYDGFGVLSCACGYCAHPAIDGNVCALCGAVQPSGDA
jgi:hypothetical protein